MIQEFIDQLWDFNDPASSEARFRDAVANATDPIHRLELLTQVARAQGLQRNFDAAHRTLDEVQNFGTSHGKASFPLHASDAVGVRCLLERGRVFNSSNQRDQAMPCFEKAFESAQMIGNDHLAIDAAHMIAIVHGSDKHAADAMHWNLRALDLANSSAQPRARQWRGSLQNNIGWTLHDQGDFSGALMHFERALEVRRDEGKPDGIRIARWCIARCLRSLNRIEESLAMQQSLLSESEAAHMKADGFIHEELGECLFVLGRIAEARPRFSTAHRLLAQDAWLASEQPSRLQRLAELGESDHDGIR